MKAENRNEFQIATFRFGLVYFSFLFSQFLLLEV